MNTKTDIYLNKLRLLELERSEKRRLKIESKHFKKIKRKKKKKRKKESPFKKRYHLYLLSKKWASIRIEMHEFYNYTCSRCGIKYKSLQVHHKNYSNIFNEQPNDLELICRTCHKIEHKIK